MGRRLDALGEYGEAFARSLQVAGKRDDAGHGIEAVVGEAFVADEVEGKNGAAVGGEHRIDTVEPRRIRIALE